MKKKRGFSLLECILAIAVVMIVSVTALSIIVSATQTASKNNEWFEATVTARNVVEIYRYCGGGSADYAGDELFNSNLSDRGYASSLVTALSADSITVTVPFGDEQTYELTYPTPAPTP